MTDLPARLRSLASSLEGDDWQHPCTAQQDCLRAADALESMPQWHDRPTGPGLWLTWGDKPRAWSFVALRLDAADLARGAPFGTIAVYGPIPECEQGGVDVP